MTCSDLLIFGCDCTGCCHDTLPPSPPPYSTPKKIEVHCGMGVGPAPDKWGCVNPTTNIALDPTTLLPLDPSASLNPGLAAPEATNAADAADAAKPTLVGRLQGMFALAVTTVHKYTAPYTGEDLDAPPSVATYLIFAMPGLLLLAVPIAVYVVVRRRDRTGFSGTLTEPLFYTPSKPAARDTSSWWPEAFSRDADEYSRFEEKTVKPDADASVGAA